MKKKRNNKKYYKKLFGDDLYYSSFNKNLNSNLDRAIVHTTKNALTPYYDFLTEAINAEKKKGSYESDWRIIETSYKIEVKPILSKFKIKKPKTMLKIFLKDINLLKDERNRLLFDEQDEILRFNKNDIEIKNDNIFFDIENMDYLPLDNELIEVNNQEVKYEIQDIRINKKDKLDEYIIEQIETLEDGWNVYIRTSNDVKKIIFQEVELKLSKYPISVKELYSNGSVFDFEKIGSELSCKKLPKTDILTDEEGIEYRWTKQKINQKANNIMIQLLDDNSLENEKSVSEYFFEDDVQSVYQGRNQRDSFQIKSRKVDDKILILSQDWRRPKELIEKEPIKISVDTNNLERQQRSITLLNDSPVKEQRNIIKLFEKKSNRLWEKNELKDIYDWYILNDESYDGTLDQRAFVKKAIATDDFAILEGPPGSGKTTTILELILQLVKDGKNILLSASTHVAIDNVLERIEKYDRDKKVEALRIGREGSVGESISHLQIDKKIENYKKQGFSEELARELVVDGANLVCGTTMGINQLPMIKNRAKNTPLPIKPIFDYMIIDESSKTTFQEFLVPAMLAKKWILIGDIKQLSPFIEQSHIVHNLNVAISREVQRAIRVIFETLYNSQNPYIIEVSDREEREIKNYLEFWSKKDNNPFQDKEVSYINEKDLFKLLGSDLILIKEGTWNSVKSYMPKTHLLILKKEYKNDSFCFKQLFLNKKRKLPKYKFQDDKRISKNNNPIEYKDFFNSLLKDKSWADEIAWRMIRVYERRMLKNPNSYYEKTYELLKPVNIGNNVDRIYNMTLPSILESLQIGNGEKHREKTTITEGFDREDLKIRHETLKTQHRMASDISKFSREEFYSVDGVVALQNARTINRVWSYKRYESRAIWIDVPKKNLQNDRQHPAEVEKIIEEIRQFLEFVKINPKNQQKEHWTIGVLTYYKPQERLLRDGLRKFCKQPTKVSRFSKDGVEILNYSVDKFQGMEADIIFLSMVRGRSIGFMDNINRLNVALTRAKYQRVIVGDQSFFKKQRGSDELRKLAQNGGM